MTSDRVNPRMRISVPLLVLAAGLVALATLAALGVPAGSWSRLRYGVHTLHADPQTLEQARDGHFDTVVQVFSWRQIEPTHGQYHWQYPDEVVQGAAYYGLDLVVRLDQHPGWASKASLGLNAPPDDPVTYAAFVRAVAARYRGRVLGYVIWNEPNLAADWGGRPPDPAGYAALLRSAYKAIKEADPAALVISAGLASTNDRNDGALDDRVYLEALYAAGGGPYFDALGAHPYGFAYPPDDPHGAHDGLNMARLADLRDIMVRHGDGRKPIWATEMGWSVHATGTAAWQTVTPKQQAAYLAAAFRLAPGRWPWLGLLTAWNLDGADDPNWAGYSLLAAGGQPGLAYHALQNAPRPWHLPDRAQVAREIGKVLAPSASHVTLLAPDAVIHLGDSEYSEPWLPLYGNRNPSTEWQGTFYLPDGAVTRDPSMSDSTANPTATPCGIGLNCRSRAREKPWHIELSLMQSNAWGNYIWINGIRLEPALPQGDYTNSWFAVRLALPPGVLRPGPNRIRVTISRTWPLLQDKGFAWDDLQIKDITLTQGP